MFKRFLYILGMLILCGMTGLMTCLGLILLSDTVTHEKIIVSNLSANSSEALSIIEKPDAKAYQQRENFIDNEDDLYRAVTEKSFELSEEYELVINSCFNFSTFYLHPQYSFIDIAGLDWAYIEDGDINFDSQFYYTYQFICNYTDDFKALRAFQNPELKTKLTDVEISLLEKAENILMEVINEGMSDYDKELAIHDYLVQNGRYDLRGETNDEPDESHKAEGILLQGMGVCESYARSANLLLNMAGVDCIYVVGQIVDTKEPHAWNKVNLDGEWYNLDITWDDPVPDYPGNVEYAYFNITDAQLQKERSWNLVFYPLATAQEYNYFIYNGLVSNTYREFKKMMSEEIKKQLANQRLNASVYVHNYSKKVYSLDFIFEIIPGNRYISHFDPNESEGVFNISFQ